MAPIVVTAKESTPRPHKEAVSALILEAFREIVDEVTGIDPEDVIPERNFVDDLDVDSLSMVEMAVQTEDKYGVKIPDEDLAGLRKVSDVIAYCLALARENPEAACAITQQHRPEAVEIVRGYTRPQ